MSLPIPWVTKIFDKLTLVYGRAFRARWDGLAIEDVKADWAQELSGFAENPDAIAYALKHIPADKPPTVLQFKDLCRKAPPKEFAKLAYTPDRRQYDDLQLGSKVAAVLNANRPDPKGWAWKLKEREDKGENLTQVQRDFWREALGMRGYESGKKLAEDQHKEAA